MMEAPNRATPASFRIVGISLSGKLSFGRRDVSGEFWPMRRHNDQTMALVIWPNPYPAAGPRRSVPAAGLDLVHRGRSPTALSCSGWVRWSVPTRAKYRTEANLASIRYRPGHVRLFNRRSDTNRYGMELASTYTWIKHRIHCSELIDPQLAGCRSIIVATINVGSGAFTKPIRPGRRS